MVGTPRHTLGSQTQDTYYLEDNTRISQQKNPNTTQKQPNNYQKENIHLTHTDIKYILQTIHSQT